MPRRLALVLVGCIVVAAGIAAVLAATSGDDAPRGLPAVEGDAPPAAYRVVYRVTTPDGQATEEHVVHRPFGAHVTVRDGDGEITAERWSDLGTLVTRAADGTTTSVATTAAPAATDVRPERFAARLLDAERVSAGEPDAVGGRPCRRISEASTLATAAGTDAPTAPGTGTIPATLERCYDAVGLVLEERWTTAGGQRAITKRAVELELHDVAAIELPDAAPLPADRGNGSFAVSAADPGPGAPALTAPDGFDHAGRFAVTPPRLRATAEPLPDEPAVTLLTEVWTRGPDLLLLDHLRTASGRSPFDPSTEVGAVELPALGPATLALDLRLAEVRIALPDGTFVRLAGTVPIDELVELAGRISLVGG